MNLLGPFQGAHSTSSPCGRFIASCAKQKLQISSTYDPEQYHTDIELRPTKIHGLLKLIWSDDSSRIAVKSDRHVEVVFLHDIGRRSYISNGSGGFGDITHVAFVDPDHLLMRWEFGKTKLWNLIDGKATDVVDFKVTCDEPYQLRPRGAGLSEQILAALSRTTSDDVLNIYLPYLSKHLSSTKLPTIDAKTLRWSPDGRWLAVLDTPIAPASVHILIPDGHLFRSYPAAVETETHALGVKDIKWSGDSRILALSGYDGRITLLNSRTFAPMATIEHSTIIDQRSLPGEQQASMWQETVSASGERTFRQVTAPFSPPLSKPFPNAEPEDLGVKSFGFSCDGSYLATIVTKLQSTVWIWNMSTLAAHAVLVFHDYGHPTWHHNRPNLLTLSNPKRLQYLFDVAAPTQPPVIVPLPALPNGLLDWIHTPEGMNSAMLLSCRTAYHTAYPDGLPSEAAITHDGGEEGEVFDEGGSEDSLFDVLSGRKPLPPKTEPSYTEKLDLAVETEESDVDIRVDDTFREKKSRVLVQQVDPFDDSEIF